MSIEVNTRGCVSFFLNLPTPTSQLREHLSRHLPTYETVPSGPRAWTYLPTPQRRGCKQRPRLGWRAHSHDIDDGSYRYLTCQPAAAVRRSKARRRARPAYDAGVHLRPRLGPANSPSAARVRGRRAGHMADAHPAASVSRLVTAQCALDCSLIQWCFGRRARARRDDRLDRLTASDRTAPHRTAPAVPRWR